MLVDQGLDLQADQLVQAHLQDGVCLFLGEHELGSHDSGLLGFELDPLHLAVYQTVLCHGPVLGPPQDLDDQVDDITGLDKPLLHFPAVHFFGQQIRVFAGSHFILKINHCLQNRL